MNKIYLLLIFILFLSGCTTTTKVPPRKQSPALPSPPIKTNTTTQLHNVQKEEMETHVEKMGVIFGKIDFEGMLRTEYVRLVFKDILEESKVFQLYIADKSQFSVIPSWLSNAVEPGYFFIQLPPGKYEISMISIPVSSALASETSEIRFEVIPDRIVYLGTLKMIGTKERIKLGGFPVIQPGFDYEATIWDEREEGIRIFHERYPHTSQEVVIKLFQK